MLPQTDLNQIKAKAKLFLMFDLQPVEKYPFIVKHPFTDSNYTLDKDSGTLVNLLEDDAALERWRTQIRKQIESTDKVHRLSMMLTKSYRSAFFKYTMEYMDVKDFSEYLADYWVSTESPNSDPNFSIAMAISNRFSKERTFVNVIMSDDKCEMQKLRDFLAEHHITNVATDSYTLDWNTKSITVTAYAETKTDSRLIDEYIKESSLKCKRVVHPK